MFQQTKLLPTHKDHLTVGFVRCERVLQRAAAVVESTDFDNQTERHYAVIYASVKEHYQKFRRLMPPDLLMADIQQRVMGDPEWASNIHLHGAIVGLLNEVVWKYDMAQYSAEAALELLQRFLDERKVRPMLQVTPNVELPDLIRKMNDEFNRTRLTSTNAINPFEVSIEDMKINNSVRTPTGLTAVDMVLGGGIREGEVIGLLGPIGGGKTLLCINTAIAMAYQLPPDSDDVVDYFTYEQPLQPDIRERIWIGSTGIRKQDIEGLIPGQTMRPEVYERIQEQAKRLTRLRVIDYSGDAAKGGHSGMAGVRAMLEGQLAGSTPSGKPEKPRGVFIDWMGLLAKRCMLSRGIVNEKEIRGFISNAIDEAKGITDTYRCTMFVAHQLSGEAGSKGSMAELDVYDASDCKQFAALCTSCLAVHRMDRISRVFKLSNIKQSRTGGKPHVWCINPADTHQVNYDDHDYSMAYDRDGNSRLARSEEVKTVADSKPEAGAGFISMADAGSYLKR